MRPSLAFRTAPVLPALLSFVTIFAASPGCAANPSDIKTARPGERFTLRVGESASVQGASMVIKFLEVMGDSRCPKGEQCVWEGDATVRISVSHGAGPSQTQDLHTSSREPGPQAGGAYVIRLVGLDPQPVTGRAIVQADYEATLQVDPQ
jgi:hypothetical protein